MATSLKMAKSNEFIEYQNNCMENAKSMENALNNKGYKNVNIIRNNNGHCIGIQGLNDMNIFYDICNKINMEIYFDKIQNEFRLSSNAMTTRGLDTNDFNKIINLFDDINNLTQNVKQNGYNKCENDINILKNQISTFAKEFPLIGV